MLGVWESYIVVQLLSLSLDWLTIKAQWYSGSRTNEYLLWELITQKAGSSATRWKTSKFYHLLIFAHTLLILYFKHLYLLVDWSTYAFLYGATYITECNFIITFHSYFSLLQISVHLEMVLQISVHLEMARRRYLIGVGAAVSVLFLVFMILDILWWKGYIGGKISREKGNADHYISIFWFIV